MALGKRIREGMKDDWREIVGVVNDIRHDGADQKAPTTVYWPVLMNKFWAMTPLRSVVRCLYFAPAAPGLRA